jgi:hypothetical protein
MEHESSVSNETLATVLTKHGEFLRNINDTSDREALLICSATIEILGQLLYKYFIPTGTDKPAPTAKVLKSHALLGVSRPLGAFSSRIEVARSVGILDTSLAQPIEILRSLRNEAAHHPDKGEVFEIQSLRQRAENLSEKFDGNPVFERLHDTLVKAWEDEFADGFLVKGPMTEKNAQAFASYLTVHDLPERIQLLTELRRMVQLNEPARLRFRTALNVIVISLQIAVEEIGEACPNQGRATIIKVAS